MPKVVHNELTEAMDPRRARRCPAQHSPHIIFIGVSVLQRQHNYKRRNQ